MRLLFRLTRQKESNLLPTNATFLRIFMHGDEKAIMMGKLDFYFLFSGDDGWNLIEWASFVAPCSAESGSSKALCQ